MRFVAMSIVWGGASVWPFSWQLGPAIELSELAIVGVLRGQGFAHLLQMLIWWRHEIRRQVACWYYLVELIIVLAAFRRRHCILLALLCSIQAIPARLERIYWLALLSL